MIHPALDAVLGLIRKQAMRVEVTPQVAYTVRAPCLLQQLADAIGVGLESGGRGVPGSRPVIAVEAWDLWSEIVYDTHAWARHLGIDRARFASAATCVRRAVDPPGRQVPAGWWAQPLEPDLVDAARLTLLAPAPAAGRAVPVSLDAPSGPERFETPPVGRLLRAVAAEAISRGQEPIADRVLVNARRWARAIETMLTGRAEQRGVRGAGCPDCREVQPYPRGVIGPWAGPQPTTSIVEWREEDGRQVPYRVPAIVLVAHDEGGWAMRWLVCRACGWSQQVAESGSELVGDAGMGEAA